MMECSGISGTNFTDISLWNNDHEDVVGSTAAASTRNDKRDSNDDEDVGEKISSSSPVVVKVPPIKCLHAHYAHYRSTVTVDSTMYINPVGELIHKQLEKDFPDLDL